MNDWMPCSTLDRRSPARAKKRRGSGRRFARLVGLAVALLIACLVLRKVVRPFALCYREARGVNEISRELREIRRENVELGRTKDDLGREKGAQTEARKLGWVMPGERSLVLENPPKRD